MTKIIYDINIKDHVFYVILDGRKIGFYLTNRLQKTFFAYLDKGVLVDFEVGPKKRKIGMHKYYQVAHFSRIISLYPPKVLYDLDQMRHTMHDVLKEHTYYLFIDFEMTMPGYYSTSFTPEIIQVGYVLSKAQDNILEKNSYYVLPKPTTHLSKRTRKFLNLDELAFYEQAIHFEKFYDDLKRLIDTYQPKFVVWGKNDISALNDGYQIYKKDALTKDTDFIDLLKLHKDYYNLKDDLGLFKAYQTYYKVDDETQAHDAFDDALVTKQVFDAFLDHM